MTLNQRLFYNSNAYASLDQKRDIDERLSPID